MGQGAFPTRNQEHPAEPGPVCRGVRGPGTCPYQVFVGEPGDLVLQAGLDAGLRGQLQVLCQQLLLPVVLFLQALDLPSQGFSLVLMAPLLRLELGFQEPVEKPHN